MMYGNFVSWQKVEDGYWFGLGRAKSYSCYKLSFSRSRKNCVTFAKIFSMFWTSTSKKALDDSRRVVGWVDAWQVV